MAKGTLPFRVSPTTSQCMYTGLPLDGSDEHILSDALGSRLSSDSLICSAFNLASSRTLDEALFAPYRLVTHHLGVPGKNGLRTHIFSDSEGNPVTLGPDQKPRMRPEVVRGDEVDGKRPIMIKASDFRQSRKILATMVPKGQVGPSIARGSVSAEPGERPTLHESLVFEGPLYSAARILGRIDGSVVAIAFGLPQLSPQPIAPSTTRL